MDNIDEGLQALAAEGTRLIGKKWKRGLTAKIAFVHPSAAGGLLLELVESQ